MREGAEFSKDCVSDETILVAAIHPEILDFFRVQLGLPEDAMLGGVAGIEYTMVTESAPGFCIVICNGNL